MIGTAKITSNEGAGKYKITQMFWDGSASFVTGNVGLVQADAVDVSLSANRSVNDIVAFHLQETYPGTREAVIYGGLIPQLGGSFTKTYVFNITADKAIHTVDSTYDFREAFLTGIAVYDGGTAAGGGSPPDTAVEWWNDASASWNGQPTGKTLSSYVRGAGGDHMRIQVGAFGDFYLSVSGASGALQARSENYAADFYVQATLTSSGTTDFDNPITLS